jgi:hypothetical protein
MILHAVSIGRVSKHDKTLEAIFADPIRANVKWQDVESLFEHLGAEISEGAGSRVRVALNGRRAVFHRPHPRPDASKSQIGSVRDFLTSAGVSL